MLLFLLYKLLMPLRAHFVEPRDLFEMCNHKFGILSSDNRRIIRLIGLSHRFCGMSEERYEVSMDTGIVDFRGSENTAPLSEAIGSIEESYSSFIEGLSSRKLVTCGLEHCERLHRKGESTLLQVEEFLIESGLCGVPTQYFR